MPDLFVSSHEALCCILRWNRHTLHSRQWEHQKQ